MNIDQTLEQMAHLQYPHQVDMVDRVMAQVSSMPQPKVHSPRRIIPFTVVWTAAATVALILIVNITGLFHHSYDDASIGSMIAQVNDYSSWGTVEEAAVNPYEYLYDE